MQCTVLLMHCTVVPSAKNCNFHRWSWIVSNSVTLKACFFSLCLVSLFLVLVPLGRNSQQNSREIIELALNWKPQVRLTIVPSPFPFTSRIWEKFLRHGTWTGDLEAEDLINLGLICRASGAEDNSATASPKKLDWTEIPEQHLIRFHRSGNKCGWRRTRTRKCRRWQQRHQQRRWTRLIVEREQTWAATKTTTFSSDLD